MAHVIVRHKVNDYTSWKTVFDTHVDFRGSAGEKAYHIFRSSTDPNDVTVLMEWDSMRNAEKFFASAELKTAMQKAGVAEEPEIQFLNEAA